MVVVENQNTYAVLERDDYGTKRCYSCGVEGCTWWLYSEAGPLPDLTYIRLERFSCADHLSEAEKRRDLINGQRR